MKMKQMVKIFMPLLLCCAFLTSCSTKVRESSLEEPKVNPTSQKTTIGPNSAIPISTPSAIPGASSSSNPSSTSQVVPDHSMYVDVVDGVLVSLNHYFPGGVLYIPEGVVEIAGGAFDEIDSITGVVFSNTVRIIRSEAFDECVNLEFITLNEGLERIEDSCFEDFNKLETIHIPSTVNYISENAFNDTRLTSITIEESNQYYRLFSGALFTKDLTKLVVFPLHMRGSFTVPSACTSSLYYVFDYAEYLTKINVESGNTIYSSIDGVLYNKNQTAIIRCPQLNPGPVVIPNGVTAIDGNAFFNCECIEWIYVPSSVVNVEYCGFSIGGNTVLYCEALSKPAGWDENFTSSPVVWGALNPSQPIDHSEYLEIDDRSLVSLKNTFPGGMLFVPEGIIEICTEAFYESISLTCVVFPSSVRYLRESAFDECENLISVILNEGLLIIEDECFEDCTSLKTVYIPSSVTSLSDEAFEGCNGMASIAVSPANSTYASYQDSLFSKDLSKLIYYPSARSGEFCLPDECEDAEPMIFVDAFNLESIRVGENNNCFRSIDGVLYDSDGKVVIRCPRAKTGSLVLGYVTFIGELSFPGCTELTALYLPMSVGIIQAYAFYNCPNLTIYCEAESKPTNWDDNWNPDSQPVVWGATMPTD